MSEVDVTTYIEGFLIIMAPITLATAFNRVVGFVVALCVATIASCGVAMVSDGRNHGVDHAIVLLCVASAFALGFWLNRKAKEQSE